MRFRHHLKNFSKHKSAYFIQCSLGGMSILVLLLALDIQPNDVVIASLGASAYILFAMPHKENTRAHFIIGGYFCGIVIGMLFYLLAAHWQDLQLPFVAQRIEICGSIAVACSIFVMVVLNVEHPPAASMSLGLVINPWNARTIAVSVIAVLFLVAYRKLFRHTMIDL